MQRTHWKCLLLLSIASLWTVPSPHRARAAEDEQETVADGPWISSVAWLDDDHVVGTRSQGLLLRPAQVVKAAAENPGDLQVLGEAEFSLWAVEPLANGRIAAADYKGGVAIYGGEESEGFELDARWIRTLSAAPQDQQLLAGTEDGKLLLLSNAEKKELKRVDAHAAAIFDIAVSQAGDKIATAGGDGQIKVFSWPELKELGSMSRGNDAVWSVVFSADGERLISGGADRRIQLWDVQQARSIGTITSAANWVTSLASLPESDLVAAGCMDGTLLLVDHRTMQLVTTVEGPGSAIWSIALAPDGKRLAVGTRKHGLAILDASDWQAAGAEAAQKALAIRPPAPVQK